MILTIFVQIIVTLGLVLKSDDPGVMIINLILRIFKLLLKCTKKSLRISRLLLKRCVVVGIGCRVCRAQHLLLLAGGVALRGTRGL